MLGKHSNDIKEYYQMLNVTEKCEKETRKILESKLDVLPKENGKGKGIIKK